MFRVFEVCIAFDEKYFYEIWIDPHYEIKHGRSISDELILTLLKYLSGIATDPTAETKEFRYYEVDINYQEKIYRLIIVRPVNDNYLGIRNAYRRSK
jgi:hypothetical protein